MFILIHVRQSRFSSYKACESRIVEVKFKLIKARKLSIQTALKFFCESFFLFWK